MYETVLSVNIEHTDWLETISSSISEQFGGRAVVACSVKKNVCLMCVGCDSKRAKAVRAALEIAVTALMLGRVKYDYIENSLSKMKMPVSSRKLLCHALTGFDKETEEELMRSELSIGNYFSIDGFYRFRMGELIERWREICQLARDHGAYLADNATMNELLRFLIDASRTKSRAEVFHLGGKYRLVEYPQGGGYGEAVFDAFDDLLCRLIDLAPSETILNGFDYDDSFLTLNAIFDAKSNILR